MCELFGFGAEDVGNESREGGTYGDIEEGEPKVKMEGGEVGVDCGFHGCGAHQ